MNAAQVRSKSRTAMSRREQAVEQEEIESGELNLIPYLDIVTNLLLFLLASVSAGLVMGQINTTLPDHAPAAAAVKPAEPAKDPNDQPLQLVVSVTKTGITLWSVTGLEGTLDQPRARIGRLADGGNGAAPAFDYRQLNSALYEIASNRWRGKIRGHDTYEIILMVDGEMPYEVVIATMDALRRKLPAPGKAPDDGFIGMPAEQNTGTADAPKLVPSEPFDPDKHYLFPDILFSKGFE
jgi:biopolymer transport protein TolR